MLFNPFLESMLILSHNNSSAARRLHWSAMLGHLMRHRRLVLFFGWFSHILLLFPKIGEEIRWKLLRSFILFHIIIFGERSSPPRICQFSRPSKLPKFSLPELALADRVFENSRHKLKHRTQTIKFRLSLIQILNKSVGSGVCKRVNSARLETFWICKLRAR